ncbi:hypothetical protein [Noviherbaspirillum sp. Root189]|uniref:hypothetical protein n=1 Tax=Noviherbaspirillum sp. Root189 TaxID=1736487 RepID=UPI00070B473E|nr:hypothetical protein [Noviherbaspirillum sp. Root189]KRB93112.1 hypothetical protein ASE07_14165 [Noviherbaspirillum sp. Root189]
MHTEFTTAVAIENLVNATLGADATAQEEYVLRQSLLNLVRLAKAEYKVEVQHSMGKVLQVIPADATLVI